MEKRKFTLELIAIALVSLLALASCDNTPSGDIKGVSLDGVWQHADKDAQLEFNLNSGLATVYQHGTHAENQGLTVIKELVEVENGRTWQGMMFDGYQNTYVPVTITLDDQRLEVRDQTAQVILTLTR
ncbi:hypothetical protein QTP81_17075 [Alteromonas sp. ASW11-36]|uniref:Lipocalin-like domain-containing protein n=1 Tax=Alteromonas arenosi TaxID=3055817 RepID=A0ABT7T1K7_9ALTE|nr:hypothetical protein [Alteromonas sp. ASW11-36]MDM7862323.1 hypothetical protein [Alteromonas sp. ASW11-36]